MGWTPCQICNAGRRHGIVHAVGDHLRLVLARQPGNDTGDAIMNVKTANRRYLPFYRVIARLLTTVEEAEPSTRKRGNSHSDGVNTRSTSWSQRFSGYRCATLPIPPPTPITRRRSSGRDVAEPRGIGLPSSPAAFLRNERLDRGPPSGCRSWLRDNP